MTMNKRHETLADMFAASMRRRSLGSSWASRSTKEHALSLGRIE